MISGVRPLHEKNGSFQKRDTNGNSREVL